MKKTTFKKVHLIALFFICLFSISFSTAQETEQNEVPACIMPVPTDVNRVYIPPRDAVQERLASRGTSCSNIIVNYINFPVNPSNPSEPGPEQVAFQFAVDIWETLLDSPVPIRIDANWVGLGAGVLGSAAPAYFATVPGGATSTLYAGALAESIVGFELNGFNSTDIVCNFNSQFSNWYFGTDGNPAFFEVDFVSVVLHELGHGLGVAGFGIELNDMGYIRRDISGQTVSATSSFPSIWDQFIDSEDIFANPVSILDESQFPDPSAIMLAQFESDNLTCNSPIAVAQNGGVPPATQGGIETPPGSGNFEFRQGSSYSHWDEDTFNGTPTALMTPFLSNGEAIHDPGNVTLGFMEDMGWVLCQGSLSTEDFTANEVKISPNPFRSRIDISIANGFNDTYKVDLIDINGRNVLSQTKTAINGALEIDRLENLGDGLYFITITNQNSNQSVTTKLIKN
ncbi:T9SS type A sorting domain-containing protein [Winogradskyella tangerina]|uniref:T9SS type A sorting domain-containing protein n=1 Tax=Winogradskyella tangerina TaxID=2023240 RepID=UPI000DBE2AE8|nr:T9SS type A sorting domain-containing protein [Winogradskyella tangerina]